MFVPLQDIPSLEEIREAVRLPRSKFRGRAEAALAESGVLERCLKSEVYTCLWEGKRYGPELDELLQMPVLTSELYSGFPDRSPRIPLGSVKDGNDGWLCSTGSIKVKYYPFSEYDFKRLGAYGSRYNMVCGFSKGDALINAGAEPPHCSLVMAQCIADAYGTDSIPVVRGMRPEETMSTMMKKSGNIVGMTGVPLVSLRFLNTVAEKAGRPIEKMFPKLKVAVVGGEALNSGQRKAFNKLGMEGHELYASAELSAAGVECDRHNGFHLFCDDNIYFLKTDGRAKYLWDCEKGDIGELCVTTPNREAFPFINFSTHDVIEVKDMECPCGITHPNVRIISRTDNVLNVGGAKAYIHHIEEKFEDLESKYELRDWQIHWRKDDNGGYHRFDILIDNEKLDKAALKDDLLECLSKDMRTKQLFQAQEAGILEMEIRPLSHEDFVKQAVDGRIKRLRLVKKF
jgi:phenylacetate-coenzyme A ligase PaaK-like adenylate-forming protein